MDEKAALIVALAAAEAYGREQYHRAEHLASVYTEMADALQAEIIRAQDLEERLTNLQAARPVDSRDARNARLRSFG